ncbi:unnamed protein product [Haemonchus placei]|uniref:ShKT domain-containing protein n=1 Tax=Haemonchus placei TaxID=6290 RepID=A0A158QJQ5_HAEPC|nr:unnamed protein product [Haemonchus placei]
MVFIMLSLALIFESTWAGILNMNCTETVGGVVKYAPSATNCMNKMSDANCLILYQTAVKAGGTDDRNQNCGGNPPDPQLVKAAIEICPQTCGFCCLTPAYFCNNKAQPRVPCSSVTTAMCTNPAWRSILEEDCPKTCGFCDQGVMLFILLFLSLACDDVQAGITDLNCTNFVDGVFKYAESAVNCRNKISDANCLILYEAAVEYNTENERNAKCGGNPPDPQLVQAAIDTCPKT